MHTNGTGVDAFTATGRGLSSSSSSSSSSSGVTAPSHLAVLVHGYVGRPDDLTYLKETITRMGKGNVFAYSATCNLGEYCIMIACHSLTTRSQLCMCLLVVFMNIKIGKTKDGVQAGGERLAEEIKRVVAAHPTLKDISFVGNSLGGLYSRYCLSLLYDREKKTIAGLQPITFLTIASPHLGVRRFLAVQVPDRLHFTAPLFLGATGNDLFLRKTNNGNGSGNGEDERVAPLVYRMAQEERFMAPLAAFKHRRLAKCLYVLSVYVIVVVASLYLFLENDEMFFYLYNISMCRAYGNVRDDLLVPLGTALFTPKGPVSGTLRESLILPDAETSHATLEIYHLPRLATAAAATSMATMAASGTLPAPSVQAASSSEVRATASDVVLISDDRNGESTVVVESNDNEADWMEKEMASRLDQLGWEKIAVDFNFPFPYKGLGLGHNTICALSRNKITTLLFKRGRSVMDHAAHFLVDGWRELENTDKNV